MDYVASRSFEKQGQCREKKHEITIFFHFIAFNPNFVAVLKDMKLLCHICCWEQAAAVNSEELH